MPTTRRAVIAGGAALAALAGRGAMSAPIRPPVKPMNILILGGTGFTGPHQVRYALARGHKVTVFNRGRQAQCLAGPGRGADRRPQHRRPEGAGGPRLGRLHRQPTTLPFWVRDAGRALSGHVGQYIFISTISVYAANDTPADETAALDALHGRRPHGRDPRDACRPTSAAFTAR